jgi:hypothetical protein
VFFVNFEKRIKELQYAHVKGIAHRVHCLLVHAKTKKIKICNKMRVLHFSMSLKIMVLYLNEDIIYFYLHLHYKKYIIHGIMKCVSKI